MTQVEMHNCMKHFQDTRESPFCKVQFPIHINSWSLSVVLTVAFVATHIELPHAGQGHWGKCPQGPEQNS